jgi:hypothetical protein
VWRVSLLLSVNAIVFEILILTTDVGFYTLVQIFEVVNIGIYLVIKDRVKICILTLISLISILLNSYEGVHEYETFVTPYYTVINIVFMELTLCVLLNPFENFGSWLRVSLFKRFKH